jgi:hypothetical protein
MSGVMKEESIELISMWVDDAKRLIPVVCVSRMRFMFLCEVPLDFVNVNSSRIVPWKHKS